MLTSLIQDCKRPSQELHDWSLRWLCAWPGSPQPLRQLFRVRTRCWAQQLLKQLRSSNCGAVLGAQQKERNWATLSGVARRNETTYLTCAYLGQSLTPTSMVWILTVLKYLQLYFTSWSLPWIYQKDECYHIWMQKDIRPHVVRTCLFQINVFTSWNWRDNWERSKSTMIKRKRRKKKNLHFPIFFARCWLWFSSAS